MDFLTVPTLHFRVLSGFVALSHVRRQILHFNVTATPSTGGTAQQLREAFAYTSAPKYLLRDRDSLYGLEFDRCAWALGLETLRIAPGSPGQSPYGERLIGSVRPECLDHVIVLHQAHLRRGLQRYLADYPGWRTHLSWDKDAPEVRRVQPPERARSAPSPKSADCIITTSAEQPEDNPHPHRVQRLRGKTRLPAPDFAPGVAPVKKTSTSSSLRGLQAFCQYAFASTSIVSPRTT